MQLAKRVLNALSDGGGPGDSEAAGSSHYGGGYAVTAYDDECCPGVVDPLLLLSVLAAIAGGTIALRQIALDTLGRKKRAIYQLFDLPSLAKPIIKSYFPSLEGTKKSHHAGKRNGGIEMGALNA